jgi:hypothetical protein
MHPYREKVLTANVEGGKRQLREGDCQKRCPGNPQIIASNVERR